MGAPELEGRKVTVVGLAKSGVAAARLCAREGAAVTVTDRRAAKDLAGPLAALDGLPVRRALGGHDGSDFERADLVVVSPGVPLSIPELGAARARGVPIWGEVELAARFLEGAPIVAMAFAFGGYAPWYWLVELLPGYANLRIPSKTNTPLTHT